MFVCIVKKSVLERYCDDSTETFNKFIYLDRPVSNKIVLKNVPLPVSAIIKLFLIPNLQLCTK